MVGDDGLRGLVARAQAFDPDAWDALYRRAWPPLFRYARRRLASDDAAHDAVSETMTRALDRISRFTWKGAGFDAWLYGIARNVVREQHRAGRRAANRADLAAPVLDDPAFDAVVSDEELRSVRVAFARLDAADQELLELRVVAGLSAEAVGAVQGRRPGAVRTAQSRALARLRAILAEERSDA